jgi:cold shock CspA family protein
MSTTEEQTQTQEQTQEQIPSEEMENTTQSNRMVGQVKWFNNKVGYGFITMKDAENGDKDIFVHYSTINVADSQYRYLVQGEYVEFDLTTSIKPPHEYQSSKISGIKGGKLMCETRQGNRPVKKEYEPRDPASVPSSDRPASSSRGVPSSDRKRPPLGPPRQKENRANSAPSYKEVVDKDGFQMVRKRKV